MMEPTVLVPLLSLLVLKMGFADHASPFSAEEVPVGPAGAEVPRLNQNHSIQAWKSFETDYNSSLNNNATTEIKKDSGPVQPTVYKVTDVETTDVSYSNKSSTNQTQSLSPSSHTTVLPNPGVKDTTSDPTVNTTLSTNDSNISNHTSALDLISVTTSKQPTQPETALTAPTTPTTEPKVSTTSSGSSHEPSGSSLSTSSPFSSHPAASSKAQLKPTAQSDTSTQTKAHTGRPAQLNVGGDTVATNKTPTLDPLLAGLVSAFILTAIIIALLLFFKLRRRDSRPEFRRLQDLPMDDMMEDAPLSMYSY